MEHEETRRGYDLPLSMRRWEFWVALAETPLIVGYMEWKGRELFTEAGIGWLLRLLELSWLLVIAVEFVQFFGKLHLVPEGIAITVFGRTIHRFPREQIRFLGGVCHTHKGTAYPYICICARSMEELAEEQARKTPKLFQNARTRHGWAEDMAGKYLLRYAASQLRQFGIYRRGILLIEWSPESLNRLQSLYPQVPWVDLTEKKILDAQRTGE